MEKLATLAGHEAEEGSRSCVLFEGSGSPAPSVTAQPPVGRVKPEERAHSQSSWFHASGVGHENCISNEAIRDAAGPANHALKNHCSKTLLHYPKCLGHEQIQTSGGVSYPT